MLDRFVDHFGSDFLDVETGMMQHDVGGNPEGMNHRRLEVAGCEVKRNAMRLYGASAEGHQFTSRLLDTF